MKCIFTKDISPLEYLPEPFHADDIEDCLVFPEKHMSMEEQRKFVPNDHNNLFVITNSPFIVACFRRSNVLIKTGISSFEPPAMETYGASFEVLYKYLNKAGSLLPQIVVDEIREAIDINDEFALKHIKELGNSGEKAYLLRKLAPKN